MHPYTSNPIDYFAIQNTLSRYCVALDNRDYDLLEEVFTEKADNTYPFAKMIGVKETAAAIHNRLKNITAQHALTSQMIEISKDGKTAKAMSYFTAVHFGKGKWQGQSMTAWGKYIDRLVLIPGAESIPGASGKWLIESREVIFMGRAGESGVMRGE